MTDKVAALEVELGQSFRYREETFTVLRAEEDNLIVRDKLGNECKFNAYANVEPIPYDPDCATEAELDAFLKQMGIDTTPDLPHEELANLILGDEARKGTFSYFMRSELEFLYWLQKRDKSIIAQGTKQDDMTKLVLVYYLTYYMGTRTMVDGNVNKPDHGLIDKAAELLSRNEFTRNIVGLAFHKNNMRK